jgi:hypothetical protein
MYTPDWIALSSLCMGKSVSESCLSIFIYSSLKLRNYVEQNKIKNPAYFLQSFRLVYCIYFLFVIEFLKLHLVVSIYMYVFMCICETTVSVLCGRSLMTSLFPWDWVVSGFSIFRHTWKFWNSQCYMQYDKSYRVFSHNTSWNLN